MPRKLLSTLDEMKAPILIEYEQSVIAKFVINDGLDAR
jgi:hypothetical protein